MIGIDIVNIKRIENLLEKRNFLDRFFTENEQDYLEKRHFRHESIAGLIAAKEAVAKAFQVGIGKDLSFVDIEILHNENNAPYVNMESSKVGKIMDEKAVTQIDINISHDGDYATAVCNLNEFEEMGFIEKLLPERDENSNKYDFGKVLIIGGSKGMTGSVILSSEAALRSGAGLVYVLVPDSLTEMVEIKTTEQIVLSIHDHGYGEFGRFNSEELLNVIQNKTVVAIGPGLGISEYARDIVEIVLNNFEGPIVLDADAINILALYPELM
ncbi:MAG: holo-ACP synthase, partial [Helcococcus sp.]|nr:holo-ACP synthase [Helcococcus sp.]